VLLHKEKKKGIKYHIDTLCSLELKLGEGVIIKREYDT
jgi:hypothetical protein